MLFLILAIGFILRLISLNQSLWLDEAINVLAVRDFSYLQLVTQYSIGDFHPPLYHVILKLWTWLFGFSEISVRFPSVIFGVLSIFLIYKISQRLTTNHSVAKAMERQRHQSPITKYLPLLASLFLAIAPLHIYYSQEARMYALAAFLVLLSVYFLIRLLSESKLWFWIGFIISMTLMLYSDYLPYLMLPVFAVYVFWQRRNLGKKFLIGWLTSQLIILVLLLPWLPFFVKQLKLGMSTALSVPTWAKVVGGFDVVNLFITPSKFILGRISIADDYIFALITLPVILIYTILAFEGIKKIQREKSGLVLMWFFLPLVLAFFLSSKIPVFSYFRLIFVLPAMYFLVAAGILAFNKKIFFGGSLAFVIIISLVSLFIFWANPKFQREDWRGATSFIEDKANGKSLALFKSNMPFAPYRYYRTKKLQSFGAFFGFVADEKELEIHIPELTMGKDQVFLFQYLQDIVDPQNLTEKELENQGFKKVTTYDFSGVGFVYQYQR